MKTSLELIALERERQLLASKHTAEQDDALGSGELAAAAAAYALTAALWKEVPNSSLASKAYLASIWPKCLQWKPNETPLRNLIKGGALIVAEIDRRLRKGDPLDEAALNSTASVDSRTGCIRINQLPQVRQEQVVKLVVVDGKPHFEGLIRASRVIEKGLTRDFEKDWRQARDEVLVANYEWQTSEIENRVTAIGGWELTAIEPIEVDG